MAHLSCHGTLDGTDLTLLLGGIVSLERLLAVDDNMLPGRPVVVLSACDVGGIAGENISAEQYGFPAGTDGHRGAARWSVHCGPLPDDTRTIPHHGRPSTAISLSFPHTPPCRKPSHRRGVHKSRQ